MNGFPFSYKIQVYTALVIGGFLLVLITFFVFFRIVDVLQRDVTTVVLLNFYQEDVVAEIDDKVVPLDIMEITNLRIENLARDATISIKNSEGVEVDRVPTLELSNSPNLVIEPIHKEESYCFFRADVTDYYYFTGEEEEIPHIRDIQLLEKVNRNLNSSFFQGKDIFVYPGNASKDKLPGKLESDQKIVGIYPIPCDDITSIEVMKDTVIGFKNYNEEENREFVENRLREIEELDLSDVDI